MDPVSLGAAALVGGLASLASKLIKELVQRKKSHDVEIKLSNGKIQRIEIGDAENSADVEARIRVAIEKSEAEEVPDSASKRQK